MNTAFSSLFLHTLLLYHTFVYNLKISENFKFSHAKKTLIKSLPDFTLESLYKAGNHLTRIANHLRKVMTKPCIKLLLKPASTMESAFPYIIIKKVGRKSLYVFSANFHIHARINAVVNPSLFLLCVFFCCVFCFRLRCAEISDCSL